MDVDLVYLWVDGSDPGWQAERAKYLRRNQDAVDRRSLSPVRHTDNDELRHSLRCVNAYAPWIRRIYIVTNNQRPWWLIGNHKIEVVNASSLFPDRGHAPSFNSMAIECHLHRIPGLSERFLYSNDDMFFGSPVTPEDFYTPSGKMLVAFDESYFLPDPCDRKDLFGGRTAVRELRKLQITTSTFPLHQVKPYTRSLFLEVDRQFPELVERTSRQRFRDCTCIGFNTVFLPYFALHLGWAERVRAEFPSVMVKMSEKGSGRLLDEIEERRPKLFCVNLSSPGNSKTLQQFWKRLGIPKAPWEVSLRHKDSGDPMIWNEVVRKDEYRLPLRFDARDVILDIGGHVGSFAHACLIRGAGKVISFEPSPENYARMCQNLSGWGERSVTINAAVTAEPHATLVRSRNPRLRRPRMNDLSICRRGPGEPVRVIPPQEALAMAGDTVRLLKLDCEGSEYQILSVLRESGGLDSIEEICGEAHYYAWQDGVRTVHDVVQLLAPRKVKVSQRGTRKLWSFWTGAVAPAARDAIRS